MLKINYELLERRNFYAPNDEINPEKCWWAGSNILFYYNNIPFSGLVYRLNKGGNRISEEIYKNGAIEGPFNYWFQCGKQLKTQGNYSKVKTYEGPLTYKNYISKGKYTRYPSIWGSYDGHFRVLEGVFKTWHENGQINLMQHFDDGVPVNWSKKWDENGNLVVETYYGDPGVIIKQIFHSPFGNSYQKIGKS